MFTGQNIMERASVILNDEGFVRWKLPELCTWLNEGLSAIVLVKPSAKSVSRSLKLGEGTLQHIEAVAGSPAPLALLAITRNVKNEGPPRIGGRTIRATSGAILDAQEPYWHDPDRVRFAKEVRQYVFDEQNPLEFYVYPGNDGTGQVEAVIGVMPALLEPAAEPDQISSYDSAVDLPPTYQAPLLDYVLYRAFSKDDTGLQPGRAQTHYNSFASSLGVKIQVEGASSPNARRAAS